jgi:hypothetical protein
MKAIFGLLLLLVGGFLMYQILPAYWGNFKMGRLIDEQSIVYTYTSKSEPEIAAAVAEKAREINVPLSPEQVKVRRGTGDLSITAEYTVHVDLPIYPMDLNFKTSTTNKDVMKK